MIGVQSERRYVNVQIQCKTLINCMQADQSSKIVGFRRLRDTCNSAPPVAGGISFINPNK